MTAKPILRSLLVFGFLLVAACNRPVSESSTANPKACATYSEKICKAVGDSSPSCASVKDTAEILPPEACAIALTKVDGAIVKLTAKRKSCDDLVAKLCAAVGPKTETCQMVTTQTAEFPTEQCDAMLPRIAEIIESLKAREAANQPLSAEKAQALAAGTPPSFGLADSKVTVVEFSDFQCPFCSRAAAAVHAIRAKYGDRVRFVFRQFPLPMHPNAHIAAEASLAAHAQGKFWELHDAMFENQDSLDRASLEGFAKKAGLNMPAFKKALDDGAYKSQVDQEMALGSSVAVQGTPTMFVNGARVDNATDPDAIGQAIDAAFSK